MEYDVFEKRKATLLAEHAKLMNEGYPIEKMKLFQDKINCLPKIHKDELMEIIEISKSLKNNHGEISRKSL